MKNQSFQVALYRISPEEKIEFLKIWLKALSKAEHRLTVIPVSGVSKDKRSIELDKKLLRADIIVLSYKPEGIFVVEKTDNPSKDIHFIAETVSKIRAESTNIKNFKYIGYIGWTKSANNTGKETVDVDYYIAKTNISGKTYKFFLAIPHHSAIGYNGNFADRVVSAEQRQNLPETVRDSNTRLDLLTVTSLLHTYVELPLLYSAAPSIRVPINL